MGEPADPLFESVREALHCAYEWESRTPPTVSTSLADLLQDPSRGLAAARSRHGLHARDLVVQASLTQALARQSLSPLAFAAIEARYVRAPARRLERVTRTTRVRVREVHARFVEGRMQEVLEESWGTATMQKFLSTHELYESARTARARKLTALRKLLQAVTPRAAASPPRFRTVEGQVWSGLRARGPTLQQWADQFKVTATTVWRWAHGQEERRRKPGLIRLLDAELAAAEGELAAAFHDRGLTT